MAGETEHGNANSLRVQYLQGITFYPVTSTLESANLLNNRRLKVVRNKNVTKVILGVQVVDGNPLHIGDFLVVRETQGKVLVEVSVQYVGAERLKMLFGNLICKDINLHLLSMFVRNNESLWSWSIGSTSPEECIGTVSVVIESHEEERVFIHCINVSGDLMVVSVDLT